MCPGFVRRPRRCGDVTLVFLALLEQHYRIVAESWLPNMVIINVLESAVHEPLRLIHVHCSKDGKEIAVLPQGPRFKSATVMLPWLGRGNGQVQQYGECDFSKVIIRGCVESASLCLPMIGMSGQRVEGLKN